MGYRELNKHMHKYLNNIFEVYLKIDSNFCSNLVCLSLCRHVCMLSVDYKSVKKITDQKLSGYTILILSNNIFLIMA